MVIIAETITRAALTHSMKRGTSDDMTIVIQD
jgi:hypothetical protein